MFPQPRQKQILTLFLRTDKRRLHGLPRMHSMNKPFTPIRFLETDMTRKTAFAIVVLATTLSLPALAYDRDNNPPGHAGGPGTNWENRPGPQGGPGASPDRRYYARYDRDNNPPGHAGGPGTNWENRPGPQGGPGASPDRR
jgi:hypothetical protein